MTHPLLAEVVRSGFVEGVHRGSAVALDRAGTPAVVLGTPDAPMLPRSANKPLQLAAMLRAGLSLEPELLAVAAASHNGEPYHVGLVRRVLDGAGVGEEALDNTPGLPLDEASARAHLRVGGIPDRMHQNCSGKHAAMLATCVAAGWPLAGYRSPEHPLQRAIRAGVESIAGEPVAAVAIDGCGAPLHGLTLVGLARAFGRLVTAPAGSSERQVADAMRAHPRAVGGTGRAVTSLMEQVPGLLVKDGAEGVLAAATPDGACWAVKIDDGAGRAAMPVLVAMLAAAGLRASVLDELATTPVLGHGQPVGAVRVPAGLPPAAPSAPGRPGTAARSAPGVA